MLLLLSKSDAFRITVIACAAAVTVPGLLAAPAMTFVSVPPKTSPHDEITKEAVQRTGFPEDGLPALQEAVRKPDLVEMSWNPSHTAIDAVHVEEDYSPSHHCDRHVNDTSEPAFARAVDYIAQQRAIAAEHAASEDEEAAATAVQALGRALHAAQDCFAHSNIALLGQDAVAQYERAVLGEAAPPDGLRLTVVDPSAEHPGSPDHPWAHDQHAADSPNANENASAPAPGYDGLTRYEVSHAAAVNVSVTIIESFMADSSEEAIEAYAELGASKTSGWLSVLNVWTSSVLAALLVVLLGGIGYGVYRWRSRRAS